MADIEFDCSACGQSMLIEESAAGMEVECASCHATITVPAKEPAVERTLSLKNIPAAAPYVPSITLPESPVETESAVKAILGKSVKWLVLLILAAGIVMAGWWVYQRIEDSNCKTRAHDIISKLAAQGMWDHEHRNMGPFMAAAGETAKELAPLLSRAHSVFEEQSLILCRIDDSYRRTARHDALTGILSQLPPGTDMTSLLYIPSTSAVYHVAFKRVTSEGDIEWLLKQSCKKDSRARKFVGDVLASYLPSGMPPQEASLIPQLSEPSRLPDKQKLYARLAGVAEQLINERLIGNYVLKIEAIHRDQNERDELLLVHTETPCLSVENSNHKWKFTLFGQTKEYALNDLAESDLSVEIPKKALIPQERLLAKKTAKVVIQMPEAKLQIQLSPIPTYQPPRRGSGFDYGWYGTPGFTKFECTLAKEGSAGP